MFCTSKRCKNKNIDLPDIKFITYTGMIGSTCDDCRKRNREGERRRREGDYVGSSRAGQTTQVILKVKEDLQIGEPPKFGAEWQERMYNQWLKAMRNEIIR